MRFRSTHVSSRKAPPAPPFCAAATKSRAPNSNEKAFGHLSGYTSAYYTYMWSLVIAKDLFSAFDPSNLFDETVAHRYRDKILAPGGSKDAAELVADFLGRPFAFDAYSDWLAGQSL